MILNTAQFLVPGVLVGVFQKLSKKGQWQFSGFCWRMAILLPADSKATVIQITIHYFKSMQKLISECKTLKYSWSSRRPHQVPPLSAKDQKLKLQFKQVHWNWMINVCLVWWVSISASEGGIRIWHKQKESMDPSCFPSAVQVGSSSIIM